MQALRACHAIMVGREEIQSRVLDEEMSKRRQRRVMPCLNFTKATNTLFFARSNALVIYLTRAVTLFENVLAVCLYIFTIIF